MPCENTGKKDGTDYEPSSYLVASFEGYLKKKNDGYCSNRMLVTLLTFLRIIVKLRRVLFDWRLISFEEVKLESN